MEHQTKIRVLKRQNTTDQEKIKKFFNIYMHQKKIKIKPT